MSKAELTIRPVTARKPKYTVEYKLLVESINAGKKRILESGGNGVFTDAIFEDLAVRIVKRNAMLNDGSAYINPSDPTPPVGGFSNSPSN